ncbi:reverse ribonuclease integrase, partial [Lasius niger]
MPFGLHSAPATFQRLLDNVIGPALEPNVFVYLDDIIIISQTFEQHLRLLEEVFRRLRDARLQLNPDKCRFCVDRLKYLGHVVDRYGIHTDPEKISAVTNWPEPRSVKQVRQFLGMASWYRRFIKDFSTITAPLTSLTKKNTRWTWGADETAAFNRLKRALTAAPVLACPDFSRRFYLQTDASTSGLGAVLTQYFEDGERVIAYASRTLNGAERNYSATELECLAVIWGIRRMRNYLEGYTFTVITDHQSLRWLQKLEEPTGRLARWLFELQQFDFDIKYRRGALNRVADALSRQAAAVTRQPEVGAVRPIRCRWYNKLIAEIRHDPTTRPDYRLTDGHLHRHVLHSLNFKDTPPDAQWKLCVPREQRRDVLQQMHDAPTAGHGGIAKTIARIAEHYYWPGMFREIAGYVRQCRRCLAYKPLQRRPAGRLHATNVTRPWEHVTLDLVGPLPRSRRGHTWLFVLQDRFSKWVELVPLRRATAGAVTDAITERVILRHGRPDIIISDNGTQLRSAPLAARLRAFNIQHRTAPIRAPHCNPVERTNRTIKTMIAQFVHNDHRAWDEHIAAFQFAFNTATHDATGFTPAYLNHGRELSSPQPAPAPLDPGNQTPDTIRQRLEDAWTLTRIQLARAFQRQERHYNLRRRDWKPKIGDFVWKREYHLSNKANALNSKLAPKYSGPWEVRRIISPVIVDLRNTRGKWYRHIHVQDLKPAPDNNNNKDE